jgi:integrase
MAKKITGSLNEKFVRETPFAQAGESIYRDGALPGFVLRVGKRTKSFALRIERGRRAKPINIKLGEWVPARPGDGGKHFSADDARTAAEARRAEYKAGKIIGSPSRAATIDSVWEDFKEAPRRDGQVKRPKTIEGYEFAKARISEEIRATPLRDLANDPNLMKVEVRRIIKERAHGSSGGQVAGNAVTRFVRALYRHAALTDDSLPAKHPCRAVPIIIPEKDQPAIAPHEMPAWNKQRLALKSAIRREAHLFCLLSGMRCEDLQTMEWKNLDVNGRKFRVVDPKGGPRRAYDLILTLPMVMCLNRAKRAGEKLYPEQAQRWVFPGESTGWYKGKFIGDVGHVEGLTKDGLSYYNHGLRRGYASIGVAAGVPKATVDELLNHQPKGVGGIHYIKRSAMGEYYAGQQRTISRAIVKALG